MDPQFDGDTLDLDADWEEADEKEEQQDTCAQPAPWARLVALDRSQPDIEIREDDTVVGRSHTNANRKVSKFHSRIYKDLCGQASVSNLSKNGTLLNGSLIEKEQSQALHHGDEIYLGPLGPGVPHYIFHCLNPDVQAENAKCLKLVNARNDFKCCICLSIWHDVVTVAPCLHNFCNGCFSAWYKTKGMSRCSCPQCRELIVFVKRNHTLSNIIEEYLQEYPSLRRPSEELAVLDQNAIVRNNHVNVGGTGGYESHTSDDEDEDDDDVICPQCPGSNASAGAAFHCGPQTSHFNCIVCYGPMPERADAEAPQKCAGCFQVFCGLYWNSQNLSRGLPNCRMKKISERNVSDIPCGTFRGNSYEQDVTKRYLQEQQLHLQDVILEWLGKMDRGEIDKPELLGNHSSALFTSESYFCDNCADIMIQHLLYRFRLSVPKTELPPDAAAREDCWYGRLCRTQLHKDSHARKLNHVCEPSSRGSRG